MVVYIQKKIKSIWCTILSIDSDKSENAYNHFCKQYCQGKFRISMNKTDDMPPKIRGLSKDEALDTLHHIRLADLTWKQSREAYGKIEDIICQVYEKYKH